MFRLLFAILFILPITLPSLVEAKTKPTSTSQKSIEGHIAIIDMDLMILPGTQYYLEQVIKQASEAGAKAIIVKLDTPGGMLQTSQDMIQDIFKSPVPVIVYVTPAGATATSAGVFITMAGHIAAMTPGTSIGAAHPVSGEGKDIEGDMRKKAENMTVAMVKSISKERGRNVEWAEKSVMESDSLIAKEALDKNVVDLLASNIRDLLVKAKGQKFKLEGNDFEMPDYSNLPVMNYEISFRNKALNFISHPNIAALLWLGATTGLSMELYNPGAILPGVVGVICLVLALAVMQIIPITQTGIILFVLGAMLLIGEMFISGGILGIGGVIALVLGAIYLVDPVQAPGLQVDPEFIIPVAVILALCLYLIMRVVVKAQGSKPTTGAKGMIGMQAEAEDDFANNRTVFVNGEIWKVHLSEGNPAEIKKGDILEVIGVKGSLELEVKLPNNNVMEEE